MIEPLIGAIAAGCCVVIKPSDFAYETTNIIHKIISETFHDKYIKVIKGDAEASQKLLDLKWDHIFFTGSTRVGKIVHEKSSKNLSTVTLELGGLNPTIVDKSANIKKAVDSIAIGKWLNLGQSCLAPNHIYVHEEIQEEFLKKLIDYTKKIFTQENPIESPNLARINNLNHFKRLVSLLNEGDI